MWAARSAVQGRSPDALCMLRRPLQVFTKAWSAALLNAIGDVLAQKLVDKNERLDKKRLAIFTILVRAQQCSSMPQPRSAS